MSHPTRDLHVGVDAGSVSVKCVVLDGAGEVAWEAPYTRHFGLVRSEAARTLEEVGRRFGGSRVRSLTFTGVHGGALADLTGGAYDVETIAQIAGTERVFPGVRTVIGMGGQDAVLFQLEHGGAGWRLEGFAMNGPCAAGTGSFIDQQAERLAATLFGDGFESGRERIDRVLADFISLGLTSASPAPVACRCTVFTKSDMIHLQNKGEPLANIIAGLHHGNAANFVSTIVTNRRLEAPLAFIGGMASNPLQVAAFRRHWPELAVPPMHASVGALGAALLSAREGRETPFDPGRLAGALETVEEIPSAPRLQLALTRFDEDNSLEPWPADEAVRDAWLGVDIGSTTTKHALVDAATGAILHKCYLPTQGRPIETAQVLLSRLLDEVGDRVRLLGVATTGSGRHVVGDFLGADLVIDEITAHARGAAAIDPEVDTIFEIGGQDSKYIIMDRTHPVGFDMNKVCAAGTGSFLHELASKMGIDIAGEFQNVALGAQRPVPLAERCTVFMESDLQSWLRKGARRDDLIAGLCYAVVHNYLNRVVGKRRVGRRVMFLGGPSLNKGIVAAFERILGRAVAVPRHREVLGACGAALALRDSRPTVGRGAREATLADLAGREVSCAETVCRADRACRNECKLQVYTFGGRKSIWGGNCGRYETREGDGPARPDLFAERRELFRGALPEGVGTEPPPGGGAVVGVPLGLHSLEWGIFWTHLLVGLGFRPVLSPATDQGMALLGVQSMTAETCFPVKVFHGHVRHLADRADLLFLPDVISVPTPTPDERGLLCPYIQGSQYMVRAALGIPGERVIGPTLRLGEDERELAEEVVGALPRSLRSRRRAVEAVAAARAAQARFSARLHDRGAGFLAEVPPGEPVWVISGRPYNLHDERCNLRLGRLLGRLGVWAVPIDFLPLDAEPLDDFPDMYWGLGARVLRAARMIARTPGFFGLHLTNFGCGADSFLEHFYRQAMGEKPSLILELDEHSATAGAVTRLEAYRKVVASVRGREAVPCREA